MHPEKRDIREYVHGGKAAVENKQLAEHLEICEFCSEYAEEIRLQAESLEAAKQEPPGTKAERLKQQIISQAFPPSQIHLQELRSEKLVANQLAADGQEVSPRWEHLKTLYCESPDVVLRLTRDTEMARDYLHVIADDSSLYAHVMVSVPDKDLSVITDAGGRADIETGLVERAGDAAWQIHLPDAVFSLETLDYDPDKTEYQKEAVLTTGNADRIRITFEGKTVGKQFSIEILQLDGRDDFEPVQVIMMADEVIDSWRAGPGADKKVTLKSPARTIKFRLFYS